MRERKEKDQKNLVREQTVEEEDGVDMVEVNQGIMKKKITTLEGDIMKTKGGLKDKEEEDPDLEEEGEEEVLEDIEEIEEPAGRILHLHLLGRKAWLGQEATPNHQPGVEEIRKRMIVEKMYM